MDQDSQLLSWLNNTDDADDSEDSDGPSEHDDDDRHSEVSCSDVENSDEVDNDVYMVPDIPVSTPEPNQDCGTFIAIDEQFGLQNDLLPINHVEPLQPVSFQNDIHDLETNEYTVLEPGPPSSCQSELTGSNQIGIGRPSDFSSQARGRGVARGRVTKRRDHAPVRSHGTRGRTAVRGPGAVRRDTRGRGSSSSQPVSRECPQNCYIGKKTNVIWNKFHTSNTTKARPQNIVTKLPGVSREE
ncbi:hypothetical protein J6590_072880 [Homalodisca vitripennis]|nr:hypothetical protein J6590_072880 [Homalodisca vitripennis]